MARDDDQVFVKFVDSGAAFDAAGIEARGAAQDAALKRLGAWSGVIDARPLFTRPRDDLLKEHAELARGGAQLPDLTTWCRVRLASAQAAAGLLVELTTGGNAAAWGVEVAHCPRDTGRRGVWSRVTCAVLDVCGVAASGASSLGRRALRAVRGANVGRDLSAGQRYLLSAPWGIGVVDVPGWPIVSKAGGRRVGVVDEWWEEGHEDLVDVEVFAQLGVPAQRDTHGTQAIGVLLAQANGYGMVGIAPGASLVFAYPYTQRTGEGKLFSIADAIERCQSNLRAGDVLLIEREVESFPVEIERDCRDVILHAVARDVVVVEPAGNRGRDLAAEMPALPDSGAIIVGAGWEGTPQHPVGRSRFVNSNFGRLVAVQAHGYDVASLAGDPPYVGGSIPGFAETSAASAIVAGAALIASSVVSLLDPGGQGVSPLALRKIMVDTGSAQAVTNPVEHIGPQPSLLAMLRAIRSELSKRHGANGVPAAPPVLAPPERRLLGLIGSGLGDDDIAAVLAAPPPNPTPTGADIATARRTLLAKIGLPKPDAPHAALAAGVVWDSLQA